MTIKDLMIEMDRVDATFVQGLPYTPDQRPVLVSVAETDRKVGVYVLEDKEMACHIANFVIREGAGAVFLLAEGWMSVGISPVVRPSQDPKRVEVLVLIGACEAGQRMRVWTILRDGADAKTVRLERKGGDDSKTMSRFFDGLVWHKTTRPNRRRLLMGKKRGAR